MAKCVRCGKSGIFLKVNAIGICKSCEVLYGQECVRQACRKRNQPKVAHPNSLSSCTEDLVYFGCSRICPYCSIYHKRVFSQSGTNLYFPPLSKLPFDLREDKCPVCGCHIGFNSYFGYMKKDEQTIKDDIEFSNRPFVDDRTDELKQCFELKLAKENHYRPIDKMPNANPIQQEQLTCQPVTISHATDPNQSTPDNSETRLAPVNDIALRDGPDWYISLSFGKSSSASFPQAIALAKMAPQYLENDVEGKIVYQAIYSQSPKDYLNFVKLYELVSNWKSCFVIINGEVVDRKIIGQLNYCYGDCCRSGNPEFCYGASDMTENPFGCHRLQISACNHPWYSFGNFHNDGYFYIDKKAIEERAASYASVYYRCPNFNWQKIKETIDNLPFRISRQEYLGDDYYDDDDMHITLRLK